MCWIRRISERDVPDHWRACSRKWCSPISLTRTSYSIYLTIPGKHTGLECLLGVYGYALMIYCDFSGYSDMAMGIARWTGFKIPPNFDSPYQSSSSITEFWRRWHISLSSWLRDYLYIPLGGNRKGTVRQYINLATDDADRWLLAWRQLEFYFLGRHARRCAGAGQQGLDWLKKRRGGVTNRFGGYPAENRRYPADLPFCMLLLDLL